LAASDEEIYRVPPHRRLCNAGKDKGLPIGNLTSQFFANVYLNELDQFIKHRLKCRHYLRYVDDFILLHADPAQLASWKNEIECFLAQKLRLELKRPIILRPVQQGANFLGYIVRPDYLLVRRRVVGNLRERLVRFEQQWIKGSDQEGWTIQLPPEPRDHLRNLLASYQGHFKHACHYRLNRRIFTRFPWLSCLFLFKDDHFIPLWQPHQVSGYRSQQRFFRRIFPNAGISIQCGCSFDRLTRVQQIQQPSDNPRFFVSKVVVRQQGYLKGGLRRRCVESIIIPPLAQTGVFLCGHFFC
ncbi:MAG: RNA-directed DNA polymerase, partial [Candidatus Electrothrix sp. AR3]|nr:RNA-directed DNA polymerase [Candidatus Electrothrix sp. AR3]